MIIEPSDVAKASNGVIHVIDKVVPDYPNAVIADWYAASKDHPEYFVSDGIHLTAKGAKAYAQLIKKAGNL